MESQIPQIDPTITMSVIVALCATLSPIFTSIINNHYQMKLKKMELQQKHFENTILYKQHIFENYFKDAGHCIAFADKTAEKKYSESYFLALFYAPEQIRSEMIKANKYMSDAEFINASKVLETLAPKIHAMLQMQ